ncbi:MAG: sensor domain-containing diguanylate cyclase [Devosia sp.]
MREKGDGNRPVLDLLVSGPAEPFRAIVANAADGVLGIDKAQRIVLFNHAAETMFGYSAAEAIGQKLDLLLPLAARAGHASKVDSFHSSGERARYMGDRHNGLKGRRADGSEFSVAVSIMQLATDDGPLMVAHVRDVSERVRLLEQQVRLATYDPLTGAFNRRAFLEQAAQIHRKWNDAATSYALLMLDLDHFKSVNDNYGHTAGDAILQSFAQLCDATLREGDVFARWGGEEFIALLPTSSVAAAAAVAERIRMRTQRRAARLRDDAPLHQTVSIGVAAPPEPGASFDDVVRLADRALYAAKSAGRNRVTILGDADTGPRSQTA